MQKVAAMDTLLADDEALTPTPTRANGNGEKFNLTKAVASAVITISKPRFTAKEIADMITSRNPGQNLKPKFINNPLRSLERKKKVRLAQKGEGSEPNL